MHGLIRCKLEHRCWHARGEDVSFTDVKIKIPDRWADQWIWMTACTRSARGGFWGFWKSQLVESCGPKKKGDFRLLAQALWRVPHVLRGGGRWKSQNRKNVYLFPYVEDPLNSKVIKSFVPVKLYYIRSTSNPPSLKCFSCFGIPMFYIYMLWTFYVRFAYPYPAMVQVKLQNDQPSGVCI